MKQEQLSLFDFGENDKGQYLNLVEEEKRLHDISEKELEDFIKNHSDPLIRIAYRFFIGYAWDGHILRDVKEKLENIVKTKTYHYGNMAKDLYIFSLNSYGSDYETAIFIFDNTKHYLVFNALGYKSTKPFKEYDIDDYISIKADFHFPALFCEIYDKNGNRIEQYADGKDYQKDIRHIVCMKEWEMGKYSKNRLEENKKPKDFYEVEFTMQDLVNYFGDSLCKTATEDNG